MVSEGSCSLDTETVKASSNAEGGVFERLLGKCTRGRYRNRCDENQ